MAMLTKRRPSNGHRFQPGNTLSPGRKGSRNKLSEDFIAALQADFHEHGAKAIKTVREKKPEAYVKVIAMVIPTEAIVRVTDGLSDEELNRRIDLLVRALRLESGTARTSGTQEEAGATVEAIDIYPLRETA